MVFINIIKLSSTAAWVGKLFSYQAPDRGLRLEVNLFAPDISSSTFVTVARIGIFYYSVCEFE